MAMLKIRNWSRWQSYPKGRGQPPWIKLHRKVMRDPNWVELTDAQRGQLVAIWLLAADHDGDIPSSSCTIQKLCYLDSEPDLQVFVDKGFIEPYSQLDDKVSTNCQSRGDKSRGDKSRVSLYSKKNITRPSKRRTIVYSDLFLMCWEEYQGLKEQGASKLKAFETFDRLSEAEQDNCYDGLACYVKWVYEKRKSDPEFRAKHLATFINQRVWENFIDADPEPNHDDPAPTTSGNGSQATSQHR